MESKTGAKLGVAGRERHLRTYCTLLLVASSFPLFRTCRKSSELQPIARGKERQIQKSVSYLPLSAPARLPETRSHGLSIAKLRRYKELQEEELSDPGPTDTRSSCIVANAALGSGNASSRCQMWMRILSETFHLTLLGVVGTCYVIRSARHHLPYLDSFKYSAALLAFINQYRQ